MGVQYKNTFYKLFYLIGNLNYYKNNIISLMTIEFLSSHNIMPPLINMNMSDVRILYKYFTIFDMCQYKKKIKQLRLVFKLTDI